MKYSLYVIGACLLVLVLVLQYLYFVPDPQRIPADMTPRPTEPPADPRVDIRTPRTVGEAVEAAPDEDYCAPGEDCIISLRHLLANLDRYDGRRVLVFGVLGLIDDGAELFVDPAAHEAGDTNRAVRLVLAEPATAPDGQPLGPREGESVLLEGRFFAGLNAYAGTIRDIALIRPAAFFE